MRRYLRANRGADDVAVALTRFLADLVGEALGRIAGAGAHACDSASRSTSSLKFMPLHLTYHEGHHKKTYYQRDFFGILFQLLASDYDIAATPSSSYQSSAIRLPRRSFLRNASMLRRVVTKTIMHGLQ